MTDETKKLFDAPWQIWGDGRQVCDIRGTERAYCEDIKDSARLARLPELYDELKGASYDFCWSCLATLGIDPPTADELIENLCPRKPSCCGYNNRWKLLQKVRNGE